MRILLFLIWVALGLVYFMIWNQRSSCCGNALQQSSGNVGTTKALTPKKDPALIEPTPKNVILSGPDTSFILAQDASCILFRWSKSDPILNPCSNQWFDSIIKSLSEGQNLEIIGEYHEKENQVMVSGDIGLIRASKIRDLMLDKIEPARIKARSVVVSDTLHAPHRLFKAIRTRTVFFNDQIKELDDRTLIYFKYASKEQLNNQLVEQYVTSLAQKIKTTNEIIYLVGHTDDDATTEHNQRLGLQRAQLIKNLFVSKGVKASRIKTSSKGESDPISLNDTEENRKLNRRVELTIDQPSQPN